MRPTLPLIAGLLGLASLSQAQTVNFSGGTDFASNFRSVPMATGNTIAQTGQFLTVTGNNAGTPALLFIYDTTPANSTSGTQNTFSLATGQTISVSFDIANLSSTGAASSLGFYFGNPANEAGAVNFMALMNFNADVSNNERARFSSGATMNATNPNGSLVAGLPAEYGDGGIGLSDPVFKTVVASYTYNSASSLTMTLTAGSFTSSRTYTGVTALSDVIIGVRVSPTASTPLTTLHLDNFTITAPSAIPEPSAFAAFAGLGLLGFAATRRRRCRS